MFCNAVYIQANLEDDVVKEALKTVSCHLCQYDLLSQFSPRGAAMLARS